MAKLGQKPVSYNHPIMDESLSESEEVEINQSEIIDTEPPKKKRTLSDKQKLALQLGRDKKLQLNRAAKEEKSKPQVKPVQQEEIESEEDSSPTPSPPQLKRTKKMYRPKKSRALPTSPSISSSETDTDEDTAAIQAKRIGRLVDKYLSAAYQKDLTSCRKRKQLQELEDDYATARPSCLFL
jgi:hypothetical protein